MAFGLDPSTSGLITAGLIGFLIGVQRESVKTPEQPGARDFLLISLAGGTAALLAVPALTITALVSVVAIVLSFHLRAGRETGITTELAAVATFLLAYLAAQQTFPQGWAYAVGLAIVVAFFLESKQELHDVLRRQVTDADFLATLKFLALIFLIYPVLPEGTFGPYQAFNPRLVWKFVILVSSISFLGYMLQKFVGQKQGLQLTAILGGLASTTAATAAFARNSSEVPERSGQLSRATILANAVQFPRVFAIAAVVNAPFAATLAPMLLILTLVGLLAIWIFARRQDGAVPEQNSSAVRVSNPMRLRPALQFGLLFAVIVFATKAVYAEFGGQALYLTSVLGGAMDADAVVVSLSDFEQAGKAGSASLVWAVFLALLANAAVKAALAVAGGTRAFAKDVLLGFGLLFGGGAIAVAVAARAGWFYLW